MSRLELLEGVLVPAIMVCITTINQEFTVEQRDTVGDGVGDWAMEEGYPIVNGTTIAQVLFNYKICFTSFIYRLHFTITL